ncbi:hypothetical protein [Amycolatopsis orientalis]|uniref:hypothetical protein n=1 Tax=Amycolatopsis orientalis TaxID=31958 RepID=UPI001F251DBC|nr:hypothetical protein [Amycolatopsis orientalis]
MRDVMVIQVLPEFCSVRPVHGFVHHDEAASSAIAWAAGLEEVGAAQIEDPVAQSYLVVDRL